MIARGWTEVSIESGEWEFIYADVGWIHEHITYTVRRRQPEARSTRTHTRLTTDPDEMSTRPLT
jgi:hypothetical protein